MADSQTPDKNRRKKSYLKLIQRVKEILYQQDSLEINYGFNPDEYSAEAGQILLRLRDAESVNAIEDILADVFSYPGVDLKNTKRDLTQTAQAIKEAWQDFEEAEGDSDLLSTDFEDHEDSPASRAPKTVKQLVEETSLRHVGQEEFNAAREYERSLIPADAIIPQQGQKFRCKRDAATTVMLVFSHAGSATQERTVRAGTQVLIDELFEPKPIVISCRPLDTESQASFFVPQADRDNPEYSHYYLQFSTVDFLDHFELCED